VVAENLQQFFVNKEKFHEIVATLQFYDRVEKRTSGFWVRGSIGDPLFNAWRTLVESGKAKAATGPAISAATAVLGSVY
jgi:hypothetical protein